MKMVAKLKGGLQLDASRIAALCQAFAMVDVATTSLIGRHEKKLELHLNYDRNFIELFNGIISKVYLERY
jgi:hypothetical protein